MKTVTKSINGLFIIADGPEEEKFKKYLADYTVNQPLKQKIEDENEYAIEYKSKHQRLMEEYMRKIAWFLDQKEIKHERLLKTQEREGIFRQLNQPMNILAEANKNPQSIKDDMLHRKLQSAAAEGEQKCQDIFDAALRQKNEVVEESMGRGLVTFFIAAASAAFISTTVAVSLMLVAPLSSVAIISVAVTALLTTSWFLAMAVGIATLGNLASFNEKKNLQKSVNIGQKIGSVFRLFKENSPDRNDDVKNHGDNINHPLESEASLPSPLHRSL